ncbi:hypothetical protein [Dolichospermum circinale]|nr:hypothetical protein [Dolichospermum circinale]MDB9475031.1 hypothetical protein [Dolichospermum circinale CS-537/11]MDB9480071.1 hypothetical protein [Dolichospermum circinale CS-537/03]
MKAPKYCLLYYSIIAAIAKRDLEIALSLQIVFSIVEKPERSLFKL